MLVITCKRVNFSLVNTKMKYNSFGVPDRLKKKKSRFYAFREFIKKTEISFPVKMVIVRLKRYIFFSFVSKRKPPKKKENMV